MMYINNWVINEFSDAPLADNRLVNRLQKIADCFYSNPGSPIPVACGSYAATTAAYRFFDNGRINPEALLMGHREQTIERMKKYDTVLSLEDTTTLDYKDHPATQGLGTCSTTEDSLGLLCHTSLATTVEGNPLGVLSQQVWTRDREADIYDFFNKAVSEEKHVLVRVAQKKRALEDGKYLIDKIESKPIMGQILASIPRNVENKRPPREATLTVKYCPVRIKPPLNRKDSKNLPNLNLYLVLAEEVNPPEDAEPIYWLLLITLPVENLDQAVEKIKWYKQRWKIERYHLVLKSGCKVEDLQLESVESLQNALAIYSIVAWKLLWIKLESEQNPEVSCDIVLQEHEWQALYCVINQSPIPPTQPPTLQEAILMIAKLGGFLARKCDGKPGVIVTWRGLRRLHDIAQGWLVARLPVTSQ